MSDLVQRLRSRGAPSDDPNLNDEAADELEHLTALLAQDIHSCHPNCTRSGCVNARLARELEEARKDAARYRWLRDVGDRTWAPLVAHGGGVVGYERVDAAIDAAMSQ